MTSKQKEFDVVTIGTGFGGMYMLHKLRNSRYSVRAFEAASTVGGVWYWNRYPGCRCDTPSFDYNYFFSEEIFKEWTWTSKYPDWEEILNYLNFVADKLDLRQDIQFNTRITSAHYDETINRWRLKTDSGDIVLAKYFIPAVGTLNAAHIPDIKGLESFKGEKYHTGKWPHKKVDFSGKRVAVVGTGASGVQSIPIIAEEAEHLTVFQRTPQYTLPAGNHLLDPEYIKNVKEKYHELKREVYESPKGFQVSTPRKPSVFDDSPEERQKVYEENWQKAVIIADHYSTYGDLLTDEKANETLAEFVRTKIKEIVKDPKTAEKLLPYYVIGGKRIPLNTGYYETYNRSNVSLVDLRETPIQEITSKGIRTTEDEYEFDAIVFATGYDAFTGPLTRMDIRGRNGVTLTEQWFKEDEWLKTYLSLANVGFPNMFMFSGPQSPTAHINPPVLSEFIGDWIMDCIHYMENKGYDTIEATSEAEETWTKHVNEVAESLIVAKVDSFYTGANIDGKKQGHLTYRGTFNQFKEIFNKVADNDYDGFVLKSIKSETFSNRR